MRITAEPRSDQWNSDDFIGGPRTFTIAAVREGRADQKYDIELEEGASRVWRPPLTMLRVLIAAWGDRGQDWVGRRVTLYRDPTVRFGKDAVGGIRISHASHLPGGKPFTAKVTLARGQKGPYTLAPLADDAPQPPSPAPAGREAPEPTAAQVDAATDLQALYRMHRAARSDELRARIEARGAELKAYAAEMEARESGKAAEVLEGELDPEPAAEPADVSGLWEDAQ